MTATPKRRQSTRILPLAIPGDEYRRLEEIGRAEERDPLQQARWIIRQHIAAASRGQGGGAHERKLGS